MRGHGGGAMKSRRSIYLYINLVDGSIDLVERRQPRPLPLQLRLRFQGGEDEQDCPEAKGGEGD